MSRQRATFLSFPSLQTDYNRLKRKNKQLRSELDTLSQRIYVDELTGVYNRAYLNKNLPKEVEQAVKTGSPMVVLMMDVDHFKQINDTHGHLCGDEVLKQIGRVLLGSVRAHEMVTRYGGDEFCALLPQSNLVSATTLAERLRTGVKEIVLAGQPVTISIGVAMCPEQGKTATEMLLAADRALCEAKQRQRDQVCIAGSMKN